VLDILLIELLQYWLVVKCIENPFSFMFSLMTIYFKDRLPIILTKQLVDVSRFRKIHSL